MLNWMTACDGCEFSTGMGIEFTPVVGKLLKQLPFVHELDM